MTSLELPRQQIAQPSLQQWGDAAHEEQPHTPTRRPETAAGALAHRPGVESVVDQVLQVLAHANLPHQLVLVAIHPRQLADVSEDVLQAVGELEGVDVVQAILHVRVDDEFGESQDLAAQVEGVAETRLLSLLGGERLHGFEIEVVVEMQVIQVLAVNEQIQHVVALTAHLQTRLHPVDGRCLEELGGLERPEQVALLLRLWMPVLEGVQHKVLEQLLIAHADFDGLPGRTVLLVPALHQRYVNGTPRTAGARVERTRRPQQGDTVGRVVRVQGRVLQQRLHFVGQDEILVVLDLRLNRLRIKKRFFRD